MDGKVCDCECGAWDPDCDLKHKRNVVGKVMRPINETFNITCMAGSKSGFCMPPGNCVPAYRGPITYNDNTALLLNEYPSMAAILWGLPFLTTLLVFLGIGLVQVSSMRDLGCTFLLTATIISLIAAVFMFISFVLVLTSQNIWVFITFIAGELFLLVTLSFLGVLIRPANTFKFTISPCVLTSLVACVLLPLGVLAAFKNAAARSDRQ